MYTRTEYSNEQMDQNKYLKIHIKPKTDPQVRFKNGDICVISLRQLCLV